MIDIRNGDSAEVLKQIQDGSIDLTVTSPPYDSLRTYNGYSFDFERIAQELYRVTKPGGVVVWIVSDATVKGSETGSSFRQALFFKECGFNLHDTMIYASEKPPLTHNRYEQKFEFMFVLSKGKPKTFNGLTEPARQAGLVSRTRTFRQTGESLSALNEQTKPVAAEKLRGNIWTYATGKNSSTTDTCAFKHPAIFPEALVRDHVLSWSKEGETVLDPFVGSGTTGKIAIQEARRFIGIEISEEYCRLAIDRIRAAMPTAANDEEIGEAAPGPA